MDDKRANDQLGKVIEHFILVNVALILCLFVSGSFASEFIEGAIVVFIYAGVMLVKLASNKGAWSKRIRNAYFIFIVLLAAEITLAFSIQK